ncbi:MAG: class I SAM-dependent methyltransferase [Betaproteobacteria bacterium]
MSKPAEFLQSSCSPLRRQLLGALAAGTVVTPVCAQSSPSASDNSLAAVIAGAHRSAANRARDRWRNPLQTLQLFGVQSTDTVLEVAPGAGWYTEILAPWLRERGRLVAAHYSRTDATEYRRGSRAVFDAFLARRPELSDRVATVTRPVGARFTDLNPPVQFDAILTFRNVHNWVTDGHLDATLQAFASVLKPGGLLGVVDHRAPPGASRDWMARSGYVSEEFMEGRAGAAGFRLAARSDINANPADTRYHVNGVWSLPPSLRGGAVDRERFIAIGESDRFTHRYVRI